MKLTNSLTVAITCRSALVAALSEEQVVLSDSNSNRAEVAPLNVAIIGTLMPLRLCGSYVDFMKGPEQLARRQPTTCQNSVLLRTSQST